jgi:hypothetical protein
MTMMHGFPSAANHQVLLANWCEPDITRCSFNHLQQLLPTAPLPPANRPCRRANILMIYLFLIRAGIANMLSFPLQSLWRRFSLVFWSARE